MASLMAKIRKWLGLGSEVGTGVGTVRAFPVSLAGPDSTSVAPNAVPQSPRERRLTIKRQAAPCRASALSRHNERLGLSIQGCVPRARLPASRLRLSLRLSPARSSVAQRQDEGVDPARLVLRTLARRIEAATIEADELEREILARVQARAGGRATAAARGFAQAGAAEAAAAEAFAPQ